MQIMHGAVKVEAKVFVTGKKKPLTAFYLYKNYILRTKTQQKNKDPDRK
jgi:hypothetical protein